MASSIVNDIQQKIRSGNPVTRLIIINVIVFLFISIVRIFAFFSGENAVFVAFENFLRNNLSLPLNFAGLLHKPWTLITYMFTHFGLMHIFWNMITLYWFGQILSEYTSAKRIIPLYLLGGIAGAIVTVAMINFIPPLQVYKDLTLIGASAGVTAIITGAATLVPDVQISLMFVGAVKLLYMAIGAIFIDVLNMASYDNIGGNISHLGGALMGYLFIVQYKKGKDMAKPFNSFFDWITGLFKGSSKSSMKIIHKRKLTDEEYNHNKIVNQKQVDAILDKISRSGYESLSKTEKEILFRESGRK